MENESVGRLRHNNKLLDAFPEVVWDKLSSHITMIDPPLGTTICEAGGQLSYAYFPVGCVLSLLTVLENGSEIECANIGREGAFGVFAAMFSGVSYSRCTVQLQGPLLRCDIRPLRQEFAKNVLLQNLLVSFSETLLSQVMQTVACNSLHTVQERMCRWLLMMHDRAAGEPLTYTHEFLARIMGANRTSITHAAQSLQDRGLIKYRRGRMQVENRIGLEDASCECYIVVKRRFDAFLKSPSSTFSN